MEKVLVTGITGYIGQHCAAELLRQGYVVVGTIRSRPKAESTLQGIAKVAPVDHLSFVEADLLSDKGWDEAVKGCAFVLHVASPFVLEEPKDENEMIAPAVQGTQRVIAAAQRAGVKRLVLTSSTFSIIAGKETGHYGPADWSDTDADIGAYAKSKTLAEHAAWKAVEGGSMEMSVINPGAVFGPSLGAKIDGQSVSLITKMITGKIPMIPDMAMGMVDVRDVAKLHVAAMTASGAAGKRFITCTSEPVEMATVAKILRDAGYKKVPTLKAPTFVLRLMGLVDREALGMLPFIGKKAVLDNSATLTLLNWTPSPIANALREMAATLLK
jgi:dihydroflavonol-4-reductase